MEDAEVRTVADLPTPCLCLEAQRVCANADRMERRAQELGVCLRLHVKTAKSVDVARLLPSSEAHGITVSTVTEAAAFAEAGFKDILYAVAIAPKKLPRLAALVRAGANVRLSVDNVQAGAAIALEARREEVTFGALVEIDSGEHRSGLPPDSPLVPFLAERLDAAPGVRFDGVYTHAGHSYECLTADAIRAVAREERDAVVTAAQRCASAGHPCHLVSVGSTPTVAFAEDLRGVTEIRPGVFVFGDVFQAALGTCRLEDVAASVLCSVISHQRDHGVLLVDAGGLALSKDRSTAVLGPDGDAGYGLVADQTGARILPGLFVHEVYQEHGLIRARPGVDLDFDAFPIDSRLRILPNHACMTAAQYDRYHLTDAGRLIGTWSRVNGWD